MATWVRACGVDDVEEEGVHRFDDGDRTFAIYHAPDGAFFATEGLCTHEHAHLADGIVDGHEIECPLHFGAFDYRSGMPTVAPACVALKTYPVKVDDGVVFIDVGDR